MKVGILTFPHSPSYGASLQMYALYKTVEQCGHTPFILNYQNKYMLSKCHIEQNVLKAKLLDVMGCKTQKKFNSFESQLNWLPEKVTHDSDSLKSASMHLDYIVVGSDQVWNPDVTGNDITYFLDFCESRKKISYAASFGVDKLDDDFAFKVRNLIADIPALSVREQKGVEIINSLTNRNANVVLDPTLLQSKESWEKQVLSKNIFKKPYIFSLVFNKNDENEAFKRRLMKETKLPIVSISDNPMRISSRDFKYVSGVGPIEFLSLIKGAEYVVTDSFHGTVFSILFNRPFYVSMSTKTNSRLQTLLSTFDLNNRIICSDIVIGDNIDYDRVNEKIDIARQSSLSFLKQALAEERVNE